MSLIKSPRALVERYSARENLDSLWLLAQSVYTMLLGLCVTGVAARVYGPSAFGVLAIAIAVTVLTTPLATMGLDAISVHAYVKQMAPDPVVLATTLAMRLVASSALFAVVAGGAFGIAGNHDPYVVATLALALVLKSGDGFLPWFQALSHIPRASVARIAAYTATTIIRVGVLASDLPLRAYAATYIIDAALTWFALYVAYRTTRHRSMHERLRVSIPLTWALLSRSWPLILSGLAVALYNRIDQVMLGYMLPDQTQVGLYAASVALAESWYFLPTAVIIARQARVMKARELSPGEFHSATQTLFDHTIWLSLACALAVAGGSSLLLHLLFGRAFVTSESAACAAILGVAGVLAIAGSARAPWLISNGLEKYTLLYLSSGAVVNVLLNLALIPRFGIVGSATATLVAQAVAVVLIPSAVPKTRPAVRLMIRAIDIRRLGGQASMRKAEF